MSNSDDWSEVERRLADEVNGMLNLFLMWRLRDIAGKFPNKVRLTLFFPTSEAERAHTVEFEHRYGPDALAQAESTWLNFERDQIVNASREFLKNPRLFGDSSTDSVSDVE